MKTDSEKWMFDIELFCGDWLCGAVWSSISWNFFFSPTMAKEVLYTCLFPGRSADSRLEMMWCAEWGRILQQVRWWHTQRIGYLSWGSPSLLGGEISWRMWLSRWCAQISVQGALDGCRRGSRVWPGCGRLFRKSLPQQAFYCFDLVLEAAGRWGLFLWVQVVFPFSQLKWFERVVPSISGRCVWYRPAFLMNGWNLAHGVTFIGEW